MKYIIEKAESGLQPDIRGRKNMYSDLPLRKLQVGDSIKVGEFPEEKRTSKYTTICNNIKKIVNLKNVRGRFQVTSRKLGNHVVELRVFKVA